MVRADVAALLFLGAFFGFQFIVTPYLQELRGWSSLQTALALLVMGCDAVLAPTLTPRLVSRYGNSRVVVGGFVLAILAYGLFLPVSADWSYAAMFPSLIIAGTAFALAYGPLTIAATESVAREEQGLAGGLLYTFTQFGSAVGISAVTAVYGIAAAGTDGSPGAVLDAYRTALLTGGHGGAGDLDRRRRPARFQACRTPIGPACRCARGPRRALPGTATPARGQPLDPACGGAARRPAA